LFIFIGTNLIKVEKDFKLYLLFEKGLMKTQIKNVRKKLCEINFGKPK